MSDPGHGPPVDALDTVCKAYKDCVKCARMEYGEMCIGEFVQYRSELEKKLMKEQNWSDPREVEIGRREGNETSNLTQFPKKSSVTRKTRSFFCDSLDDQ